MLIVLMTMIFKRQVCNSSHNSFTTFHMIYWKCLVRITLKVLSQILKIFREFSRTPCKYLRMAFETCCSWCWVPGCCCSLRRKFIFRVEQISFSKMKMLFPKWNYGYKILQRLKAWSILDWGQGERYQMKLAVQKKGEFLNTSCTLAKTL